MSYAVNNQRKICPLRRIPNNMFLYLHLQEIMLDTPFLPPTRSPQHTFFSLTCEWTGFDDVLQKSGVNEQKEEEAASFCWRNPSSTNSRPAGVGNMDNTCSLMGTQERCFTSVLFSPNVYNPSLTRRKKKILKE